MASLKGASKVKNSLTPKFFRTIFPVFPHENYVLHKN
jgi:hypothetical protein